MTELDLTAAIEAGRRAAVATTDGCAYDLTEMVTAAVRAAAPLIQRAVRERAAAEPGASEVARDVAEFHAMIGAPPWEGPIADMPATSVGVRNGLVREEVRELVHATLCHDLVGIADALADVVYVAYGTAYTYGIDLDAVLVEVHRANMSKGPGPTGKAVKGPRYRAPDVAAVLANGAT